MCWTDLYVPDNTDVQISSIRGHEPERGEQLISRGLTKRRRQRDRQWLRHWLQDFCDEAQIPRVCVHSLRGLHATLATEAGVSSHAVANALGHTSTAVTHAHYVQPGTHKRMSTRRVVQKLGDPNPVRRIPETIRGRSVSGAAKKAFATFVRRCERGTRTPTRLAQEPKSVPDSIKST
jgi:hypothetical protein